MSKRGQFFLIAALIIVVIVIGLGTVYNSANPQKEDSSVFDLSKEISFEASKVIDRGVLDSKTPEEINQFVENLSSIYVNTNKDSEFLFVYGSQEEVEWVRSKTDSTGGVGINVGGADKGIDVERLGIIKGKANPRNGKVNIILDEEVQEEFELREGQNFFIVVEKSRGGDKFVAT